MGVFIIIVLAVLTAYGIIAIVRALIDAFSAPRYTSPEQARKRALRAACRSLRDGEQRDIYSARFKEVHAREAASRNELAVFLIELGDYLNGLGLPTTWPAGAEDRMSQSLKDFKAELDATDPLRAFFLTTTGCQPFKSTDPPKEEHNGD